MLKEGQVIIIAGQINLKEEEDAKLIADYIGLLSPDITGLPADFPSRYLTKTYAARVPELKSPPVCDQPNQVPSQAEPSPYPSPLKLVIYWPYPAEDPESQSLMGFLRYFSGDTPLFLYSGTGEPQALDLGYDLNYLGQLSRRYGEQFISLV